MATKHRVDTTKWCRPNTGLIFQTDEPDRYEMLKNEAGPLLWVSGKELRQSHGRGLVGTYNDELEKPTYDGPLRNPKW